jgi:hypothetical protein
MLREDKLRHARECRQWAGTATTHEAKQGFLKAAEIWEMLARDPDPESEPTAPLVTIFGAYANADPE